MNSEHVLLQSLLRCWPVMKGINRIVNRASERLHFNDEFARVRTTDGFEMRVMPNELIGCYLYLTGEFDRPIVGTLLAQARPGDTLLDVGANIGYVSACFLANVPDSSVIAVEPQPNVSAMLRENLSQFPGRHKIANVALSSQDGEGRLAITKENLGHGHLTEDSTTNSVKVALWSAEHLISAFGIERAELIKIDVEGHEHAVIESLLPHLSRLQTRAILFEDHTKQAGPDGAIGAMLRSGGYEIFRIQRHLRKVTLISVRTAAHCTSPEFIAIKRS